MALDDSRFTKLADETMERIMAAIEGTGGDVEADIEGGILQIELLDGGKYIVNKNGPLRQLWLSSPKSGAWHFEFDEAGARWRSTRGPDTLDEILGRELSQAVGEKVTFG